MTDETKLNARLTAIEALLEMALVEMSMAKRDPVAHAMHVRSATLKAGPLTGSAQLIADEIDRIQSSVEELVRQQVAGRQSKRPAKRG
jgi:hypothetical protein